MSPQPTNPADCAVVGDARVESGPVRIGDDWAGVFIRGDEANYYAMQLAHLIEGAETTTFDDRMSVGTAEALVGLLSQCREPCKAVALRRASTPPHEQQNEPSSSPARAPGDEPAAPFALPVEVIERSSFLSGVLIVDANGVQVAHVDCVLPGDKPYHVVDASRAAADFIAECINRARRAAPPSTSPEENER